MGDLSGARRVMIVDDDRDFSRALTGTFRRLGFEVESLSTAHEALESLRTAGPSKRPVLLLTDLRLPGLSGRELIASLRREVAFESLPVIAMSGAYSEFHDPLVPFFQKSEILQSLVPLVRDHLGALSDLQFLRRVSSRTGIPETNLGRVEWFDANRGWGLLRVIGRDRALFVNAADIVPSGQNQGNGFQFVQLHPGDVVSFEANDSSPRGPRAERVTRVPAGALLSSEPIRL